MTGKCLQISLYFNDLPGLMATECLPGSLYFNDLRVEW